jgi:DNA recombination protein RmuC
VTIAAVVVVLFLIFGGFLLYSRFFQILTDRINQLESALTNSVNSSFGMLNSNVAGQISNLNTHVINTLAPPVQGMASKVEELSKVMLNTKNRGEIGETALGNVLADFLTPEQYQKNFQIEKGIVEFAVKVSSASGPNENIAYFIPIDSKLPSETFKAYIDAKESESSQAFSKFETELKREALAVAKYTNKRCGDSQTLDLGILYFPFESIYSLVTSDFSETVSKIRKEHNILVCGPNNLYSIIQSIKLCNRLYLQNKNAGQIQRVLQGFQPEIVLLTQRINATEQNLNAGLNHLEELKTRVRAVQRSLSDLAQE